MMVLAYFTSGTLTRIMKWRIKQSSERGKVNNSNMITSSGPWISKPTL